MLLDNGEGMLPAIGSTTVGSAVVVPALLKAGPPPWPDCAAADSWSAVSWPIARFARVPNGSRVFSFADDWHAGPCTIQAIVGELKR